MKKLLILIASFSLISSALFGQELYNDYQNKVMVGLRIGGNYSNVYNATGEKFVANGKYGSAVGLFVAIPLSEMIGLQPEIMYSQKGFKATGVLLTIPYSFTRNTEYIDVPLLLSIKPNTFITILAGPQLSFLTKKTDVFTVSGGSVLQEITFKNEKLRKNTLGATGGLDINFNHVVISGRVAFDLQNNNADGTTTTPKYRNMVYQATFGFRF
jgi:Outer membrane protein beta-barrel domain